MTVSTKPYLIRAIYEWCVDQGYTPHMAAMVDEKTSVPAGYAKDGQIVLNLGPDATHQLSMGNDWITFQARFGGVAHSLSVPVGNVIAVYARENGHGMAFELESGEVDGIPPGHQHPPGPGVESKPDAPRNHLKVIK